MPCIGLVLVAIIASAYTLVQDAPLHTSAKFPAHDDHADTSLSAPSPAYERFASMSAMDLQTDSLETASDLCGYYSEATLKCNSLLSCTNSGSWRGCSGTVGRFTAEIASKCYDEGSPECADTASPGLQTLCCLQGHSCQTFLYSTTTSATYTMLMCTDLSVSGIATACVHENCGPVTTTISSKVVITTSNPTTTAASTGTDSDTSPTTPRSPPPITSSTLESSASPNAQNSSSSTRTGTASSQPDTLFPESTSAYSAGTKTQTSSGAPIGMIVGGTLGGLAIIAAVAVALVWLLYVRRKDGRSGKEQSSEPVNEERTVSGGTAEVEGVPLKPELSALSPATVPSMVSSPGYQHNQQNQPSLGDNCLEGRHELSAGNH